MEKLVLKPWLKQNPIETDYYDYKEKYANTYSVHKYIEGVGLSDCLFYLAFSAQNWMASDYSPNDIMYAANITREELEEDAKYLKEKNYKEGYENPYSYMVVYVSLGIPKKDSDTNKKYDVDIEFFDLAEYTYELYKPTIESFLIDYKDGLFLTRKNELNQRLEKSESLRDLLLEKLPNGEAGSLGSLKLLIRNKVEELLGFINGKDPKSEFIQHFYYNSIHIDPSVKVPPQKVFINHRDDIFFKHKANPINISVKNKVIRPQYLRDMKAVYYKGEEGFLLNAGIVESVSYCIVDSANVRDTYLETFGGRNIDSFEDKIREIEKLIDRVDDSRYNIDIVCHKIHLITDPGMYIDYNKEHGPDVLFTVFIDPDDYNLTKNGIGTYLYVNYNHKFQYSYDVYTYLLKSLTDNLLLYNNDSGKSRILYRELPVSEKLL